jgi:hypothetical protein
MILDTLFPSIWLTTLAFAMWAALANGQRLSDKIILVGACIFGLGAGGVMLSTFFNPWWNLLEGGIPLVLLGPPIAFGGLVGAIWHRFRRRATPIPPPMPAPTGGRIRRGAWLTARLVSVSVAIWLAWTCFWQLKIGLPGWLNYHVHQDRYDAIVAKVKSASPKDGATLNVDQYAVEVELDPEGRYTITIITQDWNHAGTYGYIYDESGRQARHDSANPYAIEEFMDQRINRLWWTYYNGLN